MAVRQEDLFTLLARVENNNAAGEYYLPDIVMLALKEGRRSAVIEADSWEVAGVNSRIELADVAAEWQRRRRLSVMHDGTTLTARETVRSDEHTSELQPLMRTSSAVFCLKKKKSKNYDIWEIDNTHNHHAETCT